MFKRKDYKVESLPVSRIEGPDGSFLDIIPQLGAMVFQIGLCDGKGNIKTILKSDSKEELLLNPWFRGRILFPFNDRIPGGKYSFEGVNYQLPINNEEDHSSIHGLIYNRAFDEFSVHLHEDRGEIIYLYSIKNTDFEFYPFSVKLIVQYILTENSLLIQYTIVNDDSVKLPVALGWHPYFALSEKADNLKLKTGGGSYVAVNESLNPTGEFPNVKGSPFDFSESSKIGNHEIDIALTSPVNGKTYLHDGKNELEIYFDRDFFPYVQLFIPPERDSIAIEPVTAATNSFNINGLGRIELKPGEKKSGLAKISLS